MRNRKSYPTTPPTPSDRFFITEKGLRACGAASMVKTADRLKHLVDNLLQVAPSEAAELRHLASGLHESAERLSWELPTLEEIQAQQANQSKPPILRYGTVCGRYRQSTNRRVPDLRLSGLWLKGAGFDLGQKYEVRIEKGKLTIRRITVRPKSRRSADRKRRERGGSSHKRP